MQNLLPHLSLLGLDIKESKVYLAVLNLGKGTITDIARQSQIKRTTVYNHLEKLLSDSLVFKTTSKKRVFYCAENPQKIVQLINKQQILLEDKKSQVTKFIPELTKLYSSGFERPKVSFYEGLDGIRNIYHQLLNTHKDIYSVFSPDNYFNLFSDIENYELMMNLNANGGKMYSLIKMTNKEIKALKYREFAKFIKNKQLPPEFQFETDLLVVGETVALISFPNLIGVVIEDISIANLQISFIKAIWKTV